MSAMSLKRRADGVSYLDELLTLFPDFSLSSRTGQRLAFREACVRAQIKNETRPGEELQ